MKWWGEGEREEKEQERQKKKEKENEEGEREDKTEGEREREGGEKQLCGWDGRSFTGSGKQRMKNKMTEEIIKAVREKKKIVNRKRK